MQILVTIDEEVYRKALYQGLDEEIKKDFSPETLPIVNDCGDVVRAMKNLTEFDFEVEINE